MYTAAEVRGEIEFGDALSWEEINGWLKGRKSVIVLRGEAVEVEKIESSPGVDDYGDTAFIVVKVGAQFFKKEGYYSSHSGDRWDGKVTEVIATEKTVYVYEPAAVSLAARLIDSLNPSVKSSR